MTHRTRTAHPGRYGSPAHLGGRFLGALWPGGPTGGDERWALGQLLPGERELWRRMRGPDRRHAVRVARASAQLLERAGEAPRREIVAAALLHDVGKVASRLGTLARVVVTFASVALGEERVGGSRGAGRRAGARRYLEHDRIGGELLRRAGSDPLTVAWAEQHHLPPERWTIDRRLGELLKAADGG
jgi:putative nucleotidyltransferase with HDIG domain